jgi:hypothetical protein
MCDTHAQSANKPTKLSKLKRNSSVPPVQPPIPPVPPKRPKALASSRQAVQRQQLSQTNTSLRTRFSSCGTSLTTSTKIRLRVCLGDLRDSRRPDWYLDGKVLLSLSTRTSLGQLVLRRPRRECLWEMGSLFGLRTRDSDVYVCTCRQTNPAFGRNFFTFLFSFFFDHGD